MDRRVLSALAVAKRLGPFWLALSLSGCVLNPIGEDPGYEENNTADILGGSEATGASPGGLIPPSGPQGAAPVTPGPAQGATDPAAGIPNPLDPTGPSVPGAGPPPAAPAGTSPVDAPGLTPTPEPVQGAGGASAGSGGSPSVGEAGAAGEPEPDAMVPGMDFDGGTFNYGQDADGGSNDDSEDGGRIDAGVGL